MDTPTLIKIIIKGQDISRRILQEWTVCGASPRRQYLQKTARELIIFWEEVGQMWTEEHKGCRGEVHGTIIGMKRDLLAIERTQ